MPLKADFNFAHICRRDQQNTASKFGWLPILKTANVNNNSVYLSKEADVPQNNGLGYDVIMKMDSPFLKHRHVFFNNFFTGTKLMDDLLTQDTYACSTI